MDKRALLSYLLAAVKFKLGLAGLVADSHDTFEAVVAVFDVNAEESAGLF